MSTHIKIHYIILGLSCLFLSVINTDASTAIEPPAGIDHSELNQLLEKYVDKQGLVDYQSWKNNETDRKALDRYLSQYDETRGEKADGNEKIASLINAYNAFTLQWILINYPTESIRVFDDSWTEKRHKIGGKVFSLNELEHDNLRPLIGWRVHSAIVCAARSCPPLQPTAYTKENLNAMIDTAYRQWLSNYALNSYHPKGKKVELSLIFKWFEEDFKLFGGVQRMLAKYGPEEYRAFLQDGDYKIKFKEYHWGLNDQSGRGNNYQHGFLKSLF